MIPNCDLCPNGLCICRTCGATSRDADLEFAHEYDPTGKTQVACSASRCWGLLVDDVLRWIVDMGEVSIKSVGPDGATFVWSKPK